MGCGIRRRGVPEGYRYARPSAGTFQQTAASIGIPQVRLYVYPPTLADLLVPFTFLSVHMQATRGSSSIFWPSWPAMLLTWMLYDTAFHILHRFFLRHPAFSRQRLELWRRPDLECPAPPLDCRRPLLRQGIQAHLSSCLRAGNRHQTHAVDRPSAVCLARRSLGLLVCPLTRRPLPHPLPGQWPPVAARLHPAVMPPMSAGFISASNVSLPSGLQQLYLGLTGGNFMAEMLRSPSGDPRIKAHRWCVCMLVTLIGIYRLGSLRSIMERAKILSLIALLSLYCSPVAWRSAYGIVFLAAFFLWKEASSVASPNSSCFCSSSAPSSSASSSIPSFSVSRTEFCCPRQRCLHLRPAVC